MPVTTAYLAALRILQYRFNSEEELRTKLRRKGFGSADIDAALEQLRAESWLDDDRFAAAFVRSRVAKRIGRNRIARELGAAGVGDDSIARAIAENVDGELERDALMKLCVKRADALSRRHGADFVRTAEGREKIAGWLVQKGYDASAVREVVREFLRARS